jgi:ATP-binding protein involved in chromosome partitioning
MTADVAEVLAALSSLKGPDARTPLPKAARLSDVVLNEGKVNVSISIDPQQAEAWEPVRAQAQAAVAALPGITSAIITLTADRPARVAGQPAAKDSGAGQEGRPAATSQRPAMKSLAGVRHIVAVASGKGGVGKSTTACNLALALAARGLAVGVLDADIYGPSMPKLFALKGSPRIVSGRTLAPMESYGCKVMSIGFVVDPEKAIVWRGPMVASAITQMLRDVEWGTLDVLIVDMPPGTGDAQLTLAQAVPLAGAVIVSTPQDLALIDARRGVAMFRNVDVPILGLIENMSYFVCDQCGKRHDIFAHGGARVEADRQGVPFLGEIPLEARIRELSDAGLPVVVSSPDGPEARAYGAIAGRIWRRLGHH